MDDLISRQEVLEALEKFEKQCWEEMCFRPLMSDARVIIKSLPSASPEQKTATFYVDSEGYERCSACNEHESGMRYFNFCPNCGAKMESDNNDS